jgi:ABC-type multidrug transport system fused ATPase/permease subunit
VSWFSIFSVFAFVAALTFASVGLASGLSLFTRTDFSVHVIVLYVFCISSVAHGLFVASLVRQPRWVIVASFLTVSIWVIASFFFTIPGLSSGTAGSFANEQYVPGKSVAIQFLVYTQPWFHASKIYGDIIATIQIPVDPSSPVPDYRHYTFESLSQRVGKGMNATLPLPSPGDGLPSWYAPSANYSLWCLLELAFIYSVFAWYCGQAFGGDQLSLPLHFPFTVSYWTGRIRPTDDEDNDAALLGDTHAAVQQESASKSELKLLKLSKSFENTTAVKELSLTMKKGEIFCLLGHNGAGKTTTINCLTGLHNITHGDAFVFGKSVRSNMTEIQTMMGVCPQHDVLWPE